MIMSIGVAARFEGESSSDLDGCVGVQDAAHHTTPSACATPPLYIQIHFLTCIKIINSTVLYIFCIEDLRLFLLALALFSKFS